MVWVFIVYKITLRKSKYLTTAKDDVMEFDVKTNT